MSGKGQRGDMLLEGVVGVRSVREMPFVCVCVCVCMLIHMYTKIYIYTHKL